MKFCSYCGKELQDYAVFCTACNSNLSPMPNNAPNTNYNQAVQPIPYQYQQQNNPVQQPYQQPNQYQPPYQPYYPNMQTMDVNVIEKLKKLANSPLLIILASLLSVNLLFSIISIFSNATEYTFLVAPFGLVLPVLIVVGVWIVFANRNSIGNRNTAGITLIQTSVIITFILTCLSILMLVGLMVITAIAFSEISYSVYEPLFAVILTFLFVGLVLLIFNLVYYILLIRTIASIKKSFSLGLRQTKGIMGTVVFNIIYSVFSLFSAIVIFITSLSINANLDDIMSTLYYLLPSDLSSTLTGSIYTALSPTTLAFNGITVFVGAAILIISSILLLNYKKEMEQ